MRAGRLLAAIHGFINGQPGIAGCARAMQGNGVACKLSTRFGFLQHCEDILTAMDCEASNA
jgi:hypothetical protein